MEKDFEVDPADEKIENDISIRDLCQKVKELEFLLDKIEKLTDDFFPEAPIQEEDLVNFTLFGENRRRIHKQRKGLDFLSFSVYDIYHSKESTDKEELLLLHEMEKELQSWRKRYNLIYHDSMKREEEYVNRFKKSLKESDVSISKEEEIFSFGEIIEDPSVSVKVRIDGNDKYVEEDDDSDDYVVEEMLDDVKRVYEKKVDLTNRFDSLAEEIEKTQNVSLRNNKMFKELSENKKKKCYNLC